MYQSTTNMYSQVTHMRPGSACSPVGVESLNNEGVRMGVVRVTLEGTRLA